MSSKWYEAANVMFDISAHMLQSPQMNSTRGGSMRCSWRYTTWKARGQWPSPEASATLLRKCLCGHSLSLWLMVSCWVVSDCSVDMSGLEWWWSNHWAVARITGNMLTSTKASVGAQSVTEWWWVAGWCRTVALTWVGWNDGDRIIGQWHELVCFRLWQF